MGNSIWITLFAAIIGSSVLNTLVLALLNRDKTGATAEKLTAWRQELESLDEIAGEHGRWKAIRAVSENAVDSTVSHRVVPMPVSYTLARVLSSSILMIFGVIVLVVIIGNDTTTLTGISGWGPAIFGGLYILMGVLALVLSAWGRASVPQLRQLVTAGTIWWDYPTVDHASKYFSLKCRHFTEGRLKFMTRVSVDTETRANLMRLINELEPPIGAQPNHFGTPLDR